MAWAPDYVTRTEFKAYARIGDTADDAEIDSAITMASRAVDKQTGRQFGQVAAAEDREYTLKFSRSRGGVWMAEVDDYQDLTGMVVKFDAAGDGTFSTTVPAASVVPWPRNALKLGFAYTRVVIRPSGAAGLDDRAAGVLVTLKWGWNASPVAVKGAVKLQVNRMHARRDAPFGVAGSPEQGSEVRLLAKLDPDVAVGLERYRRRAWAR